MRLAFLQRAGLADQPADRIIRNIRRRGTRMTLAASFEIEYL